MKKIFEKLIPKQNQSNLCLGFSGTTLRWVYSKGTRDMQGRVIIDSFGSIPHFQATLPTQWPTEFKKSLSRARVRYIVPASTCTQSLLTESVTMNQVRKHAPGYVVSQRTVPAGSQYPIYATVSIHMDGIASQMQILQSKGITPHEIHHVSDGYLDRQSGMENPAVCVISLGESYSWMAWISGGVTLYQQDIPIGRSALVTTIAQAISITEQEARKILDKYGVTRLHPDMQVLQALYTTLRPISDTLNTWINDHAQFTYIKQPFQGIPGLIHITGSASDIGGIEQFFVLQTGISAENIGKKLLEQYITALPTHISTLYEYEPLVMMIPRGSL